MKNVLAVVFCAVVIALGVAQDRSNKSSQKQDSSLQILTVDALHPGMKGVAYTVFQGTRPEAMGIEVLGVLKNLNGPRSDMILVRLTGPKPEYTGVVAGMSGSPVYIDGKLVGAIAYRIGAFSKEPIAGVTPIADMLEISEFDKSISAGSSAAADKSATAEKTSSPGNTAAVQNYTQLLTPIDAPFVFNGFSESAIKTFADKFAAAGIVPVMGVGSASDEKQPEPMEPGSAVSAVLVRGDMNAAAICTVTYVEKTLFLACAHPLLQSGLVDIPLAKPNVVTPLSSPLNAFKTINPTEPIGAFVQDRHTGILGRFNKEPQMI